MVRKQENSNAKKQKSIKQIIKEGRKQNIIRQVKIVTGISTSEDDEKNEQNCAENDDI